ncbi:MAG: hypothetical protein HY657_09605 [Acidobacteria bacterium]|nr:hypothetical protein [Acidobacteriota bacterium]
MGCPSRVRAPILRFAFASLALSAAVACSGGNSESGTAGTAGADAPFSLEITQAYITVENRTGTTILGGQLEITQAGVRPPFRANLPRLEIGASRDLPLNTFRASDGTIFSRGLARARTLMITAKDLGGKEYQQEFPFR